MVEVELGVGNDDRNHLVDIHRPHRVSRQRTVIQVATDDATVGGRVIVRMNAGNVQTGQEAGQGQGDDAAKQQYASEPSVK